MVYWSPFGMEPRNLPPYTLRDPAGYPIYFLAGKFDLIKDADATNRKDYAA
jgi:hypothetical protein